MSGSISSGSESMSKDSKELSGSSLQAVDSPRTENTSVASLTKRSSGDLLSPEEPAVGQQSPNKRRAPDDGEDDSDENAPVQGESHRRDGSGDSSVSTISQVCVCQPDPKIPRPPNAFILYRQHHQANLIATYPGLKNPDISKIIGDQWRNQPVEVKNEWKVLAEEAKARHAAQYPDYKYQPKRSGRQAAGDAASTAPSRCPKCGGRILGSLAPTDNYTSPHPIRPRLESSRSSDATPSYRPIMHEPETPPKRHVGRSAYHPTPIPGQAYNLTREYRDELYPTNESKRRRLDYTAPQPLPVPVPVRPMPLPYPASPLRYPRDHHHPTLHRSSSYHHTTVKASSSPPPLAPGYRQSMAHGPPTSAQSMDRSLILPPIQSAPTPTFSVEETVMGMAFMGKVSLLGKIAPPLKKPLPAQRHSQTRGPLIAVEADDPSAIIEVVDYLYELLSQNAMNAVKVFAGPEVPRTNEEASFSKYIGVVQEWHAKSKEIATYITTRQPPPRERTRHDTPPEDTDPRARVPMVLLNGFSLMASNRYACSIPVTDVYTSLDHWQWMATMWRGIIGPDVTVYVSDVTADEMSRDRVEVRDEVRCIVVKRERGSTGAGARIDNGTLRRLGFEIGEWIRDVEGISQGDVESKSRRPSPPGSTH